MGEELANSTAFAQCQVEKVFKTVCFRAPGNAADRAQVATMTNNFRTNGYRLKQVFAEPLCTAWAIEGAHMNSLQLKLRPLAVGPPPRWPFSPAVRAVVRPRWRTHPRSAPGRRLHRPGLGQRRRAGLPHQPLAEHQGQQSLRRMPQRQWSDSDVRAQ
jgi:hypothetical protein